MAQSDELWYDMLGSIYFYYLDDMTRAFAIWDKHDKVIDQYRIQAWFTVGEYAKSKRFASIIPVDSKDYWLTQYYIAESARFMNMEDTSAYYFSRIIDSAEIEFKPYDNWKPNYLFVAISLHRMGNMNDFRQLLDTAKLELSKDAWFHFHLSRIYANTQQEKLALESLQKAIDLGWQPNNLMGLEGTLCDPLLNPIRETKAFKAMVREHFPKYYDIATRIPGKH